MPGNVVCLILTHGEIASALVDASKKITGGCEQLFELKVEKTGLMQLEEDVSAFLKKYEQAEGILLMACIKGGSYWNAAIRASRGKTNVKVLSGVNLPMVLSFITKRNSLPFPQLAETLYNDAQKGIVIFEKKGD